MNGRCMGICGEINFAQSSKRLYDLLLIPFVKTFTDIELYF